MPDSNPPFSPSASRRVAAGACALAALLAFWTASSRSHDAGHPASFTQHASLVPTALPAALAERLTGTAMSRREDPIEVDWRLLAGLDYESGEMTDDLKAVVGNEAKVPGFMVPLEDYLERVTEFLLVPYVGACVHTPPPPPNQLVYVKLPKGERAKVEWWDPIWVEGVLTIDQTENIYGSVSYTIDGASVTSYSN